jgi:hypothetical protein
MSFEHDQLIAHGDFNGEAEKRRAVFLARLFEPGGLNPADLEPHNFEDVNVHIAPDVLPASLASTCMKAQIDLDLGL